MPAVDEPVHFCLQVAGAAGWGHGTRECACYYEGKQSWHATLESGRTM
jgi:hypothetical protein